MSNSAPTLNDALHALQSDPAAIARAFGAVAPLVEGMRVISQGHRVAFFADRGADVLGVAHLDTVLEITPPTVRDGVLRSTGCDDRLGVHILAHVLQRLGINTDLLLTTDEERGRSTGDLFVPQKPYKFLAEFDRRGCDVVMYRYHSAAAERVLNGFGMDVGRGSYSDISVMGRCECPAANFGVGYHHNHSPNAFADLYQTAGCLVRYHRFHTDVLEHLSREEVRRVLGWEPHMAADGLGDWLRDQRRERRRAGAASDTRSTGTRGKGAERGNDDLVRRQLARGRDREVRVTDDLVRQKLARRVGDEPRDFRPLRNAGESDALRPGRRPNADPDVQDWLF